MYIIIGAVLAIPVTICTVFHILMYPKRWLDHIIPPHDSFYEHLETYHEALVTNVHSPLIAAGIIVWTFLFVVFWVSLFASVVLLLFWPVSCIVCIIALVIRRNRTVESEKKPL